MTTSIRDIEGKFVRHNQSIRPGLPMTLVAAATFTEGIAQGDLYLTKWHEIPKGYVLVKNPTDADLQLVPEAGAGSHHRLHTWDGVTMYRPSDYGPDMEGLLGPCLVLTKTTTVYHEPGTDKPHGPVTIEVPEGETVIILCGYQADYDNELKRTQRTID